MRAPRDPRRTLYRRLLWIALALTTVAHLAALRLMVIPEPVPVTGGGDIQAIPNVVVVQPPAREEPPGESESVADDRESSSEQEGERVRRWPAIAIPIPSAGAPESETIPPTTRLDLYAATLPLVASPAGVTRRAWSPSPETLARARADSVLMAMMADVMVAEPPDEGRVTLPASGGVAIAIPWQGFLPDERWDRKWRAERCAGGAADADMPGEAAGQRAQCD